MKRIATTDHTYDVQIRFGTAQYIRLGPLMRKYIIGFHTVL